MSKTEFELEDHEEEDVNPLPKALCLSGGGYRAMLFHVGSILRMREMGLLQNLDLISSVSGGSITSAMLALAWDTLGNKDEFFGRFVNPVRRLASTTIDRGSVLRGALPGLSVCGSIEKAYRRHLFGEKTLQDLPDTPRFVINATNLQSGALWRFSKPYARDYRVGKIKHPVILLAKTVAASSAFPPILSPSFLDLDPPCFEAGSGRDLQREPFTSRPILSDGGVYDNLGIEAAWKRSETIFVSDAGGKMQAQEKVKVFWPTQLFRVYMVTDNQVRGLRKRWYLERKANGSLEGSYWGIRTDIGSYPAAPLLQCRAEGIDELARTPTRLKALREKYQERLINWGYASCDASIRSFYDRSIPIGEFPYPDSVV